MFLAHYVSYPFTQTPRRPGGKKVTHTPGPKSATHHRAKTRKQPAPRRFRPGTVALREIRHFQKTTMLLIRKAPFARLVREILLNSHPSGNQFRWQQASIECLQEAAEAYLIHFMSDAYLCSLHSKRVTLMPKDFFLIKRLRNTQL